MAALASSMDILFEMGLALALGALIGIERERRAAGIVFAGIRSFTLITFAGYLTSLISNLIQNSWLLVFTFVGVVAISAANHYVYLQKRKRKGITTEVAFIISFLIGVLIFYEARPYVLSIFSAAALTFILFIREESHKFAKRIKPIELLNALVFAMLAFVLLPLLPNYYVDPWQAINPRQIFLAFVLVTGISLLAYIIFKLKPGKGSHITGIVGGLISSTATTVDATGKFKGNPKIAALIISSAGSIMYVRQYVLITLLNPSFWLAAWPMLFLAAVGLAASYYFFRSAKPAKLEIKNPIGFKQAFYFVVLITLVFILARTLPQKFGARSLYLIAFLTGLPEIDAPTIAFLQLDLAQAIFLEAALIISIANTLLKLFLAYLLGNEQIFANVAKVYGLLIVVSLAFIAIF